MHQQSGTFNHRSILCASTETYCINKSEEIQVLQFIQRNTFDYPLPHNV